MGSQAKWAVRGLELSSQNPVVQVLSLGGFSFPSAKLSSRLALGQREVQGWIDSPSPVQGAANYRNSRTIFQGLVRIKRGQDREDTLEAERSPK